MKGIAQCMGLKYPSHLPGLECFGQFILDVTDARFSMIFSPREMT